MLISPIQSTMHVETGSSLQPAVCLLDDLRASSLHGGHLLEIRLRYNDGIFPARLNQPQDFILRASQKLVPNCILPSARKADAFQSLNRVQFGIDRLGA